MQSSGLISSLATPFQPPCQPILDNNPLKHFRDGQTAGGGGGGGGWARLPLLHAEGLPPPPLLQHKGLRCQAPMVICRTSDRPSPPPGHAQSRAVTRSHFIGTCPPPSSPPARRAPPAASAAPPPPPSGCQASRRRVGGRDSPLPPEGVGPHK